jgi:hypothetical protein
MIDDTLDRYTIGEREYTYMYVCVYIHALSYW